MKIDYHIHTEHSWDASGTIAEYCLKALEVGLDEIGFSEHIDFDPIDRAYGYHNFKRIDRAINDVREMFNGTLVIRKGIEITYQDEYQDQIAEAITEWNYDYTIAGIHLSNGIFYTSDFIEEYYRSEPDPSKAFRSYFDELHRAINSRLIDIVAHIDVLKRHSTKVYGEFKPTDFAADFERILNDIIVHGCALEINSGDIANRGKTELYPSDWILMKYKEMGGERITYGSDSHKPSALSVGYDVALETAKRIGFKGWTIYEKREPRMVLFD